MATKPTSQAHTAGPWQSSKENVWLISDAENNCVAEASISYRSKEEVAANARLIATAPELLTALYAIVDLIEDGKRADYWMEGAEKKQITVDTVALYEAYTAATLALAKAEGK